MSIACLTRCDDAFSGRPVASVCPRTWTIGNVRTNLGLFAFDARIQYQVTASTSPLVDVAGGVALRRRGGHRPILHGLVRPSIGPRNGNPPSDHRLARRRCGQWIGRPGHRQATSKGGIRWGGSAIGLAVYKASAQRGPRKNFRTSYSLGGMK